MDPVTSAAHRAVGFILVTKCAEMMELGDTELVKQVIGELEDKEPGMRNRDVLSSPAEHRAYARAREFAGELSHFFENMLKGV